MATIHSVQVFPSVRDYNMESTVIQGPHRLHVDSDLVAANAGRFHDEVLYVNGFPGTIWVIKRSGVPIRIDPIMSGEGNHRAPLGDQNECVDIYSRIEIRNGDVHAENYMDPSYNTVDYRTSREREMYFKAKRNKDRCRVASTNTPTHVYYGQDGGLINYYAYKMRIPREDLVEFNNRGIYIPSLDVVITVVDPVTSGIHHPHQLDMAGNRIYASAGFDVESGKATSFSAVIVDPDRQFGDRYINVGGRVMKVVATDAVDVRPGVYVFTSLGSANNKHTQEASEQYRFDELDKCPFVFYRTEDEAKFGGDPAKGITLETQRLAAKKAEHEAETLDKKQEYEREKIERDAYASYAAHQEKVEEIRRTAFLSALKWIAGTITAIAGIVTAIICLI